MEVVATSEAFDLDDSAGVGAVRRRAMAHAVAAGLDEVRAGDTALIATELASNVLKHARCGGALVGQARAGARCGVGLAAWDRGPGMNLEACLRDGMSTAGTRGAGLGAAHRLATRFDAYTPPGLGSVVTATVLPAGPPPITITSNSLASISISRSGISSSSQFWLKKSREKTVHLQ